MQKVPSVPPCFKTSPNLGQQPSSSRMICLIRRIVARKLSPSLIKLKLSAGNAMQFSPTLGLPFPTRHLLAQGGVVVDVRRNEAGSPWQP